MVVISLLYLVESCSGVWSTFDLPLSCDIVHVALTWDHSFLLTWLAMEEQALCLETLCWWHLLPEQEVSLFLPTACEVKTISYLFLTSNSDILIWNGYQRKFASRLYQGYRNFQQHMVGHRLQPFSLLVFQRYPKVLGQYLCRVLFRPHTTLPLQLVDPTWPLYDMFKCVCGTESYK